MNLIDRLNDVFAIDPSSPAVEFHDVWYSWNTLQTAMKQIHDLLTSAGVGENESVGIVLRNHPGLFAAAVGVITSKRCMMPLNAVQPDNKLTADIEELKARAVIATEEDWSNENIRASIEKTGAIGISIITEGEYLKVQFVSGMERVRGDDFHESLPDIAINMLTSGTTGKPKRVQLKLSEMSDNLWAGSQYEANAGKLELQKSAGLLWAPLVHIGGIWTAIYLIYNGRKFALMERFSPKPWHELVVKHRIRFLSLTPSALRMVLDENFPAEDFAHVVAVRAGTAPLNPDMADEFEARYGVPVLDVYGATEFAGGVAAWSLGDHKKYWKGKRGSVGRASAGIALRVVDEETFETLPVNGVGLLEVNSANGADGKWLRTTDRSRVDEDGFLFILGRADNAIIRGGFKIAPDDVVKAMQKYPAIREASVVPIDDERLGQVPVSAYILEPGTVAPSDEELSAYLKESLKPYEVPVKYMVVEELPRSPSLKISLIGVKELFAANS